MKQRLHITLPVLVLALTFMLHSCKPESPCNENQRAEHLTYHLEPGTKEQIPYRADGLDTLVYISDAGDTATLYGQGIKTYYTGESRNRNADPDCPLWDTWSYETWEYSYAGANASIKYFNLRVISGDDKASLIDFKINDENYDKGYFGFVNDTTRYMDTVIIDSKIYYGITVYDVNKPAFLYNLKYGLLKINFNNSVWRKHF